MGCVVRHGDAVKRDQQRAAARMREHLEAEGGPNEEWYDEGKRKVERKPRQPPQAPVADLPDVVPPSTPVPDPPQPPGDGHHWQEKPPDATKRMAEEAKPKLIESALFPKRERLLEMSRFPLQATPSVIALEFQNFVAHNPATANYAEAFLEFYHNAHRGAGGRMIQDVHKFFENQSMQQPEIAPGMDMKR